MALVCSFWLASSRFLDSFSAVAQGVTFAKPDKNDEIISIARNEEKDDDESAENVENATVDATANEGTAQSPESAVEAPAETNAESGDGENVEA